MFNLINGIWDYENSLVLRSQYILDRILLRLPGCGH